VTASPPPSRREKTAGPNPARKALSGAGYGLVVWLGITAVLGGAAVALMLLRDGRDAADGYLPMVLAVLLSGYGYLCWPLTAVAAAIAGASAPPARLRRRACVTALVAGTALAFAGPAVLWLLA